MSFTDVQNKTTITGFSDADKATILTAMQTAYEGSATAKAMFDDWISANPDPGKKITINYDDVPASVPGTGEVWINLDFVNRLLYIDNNGTAVKHTVVTVIVHELVHALTGKLDDGTGGERDRGSLTDYKGATVIESNKIYLELGLPEQNSYIGQSDIYLTEGTQYTNGAAIDRSVCVSSTYAPGTIDATNDWDSSPAGNSNDLLIGDADNNILSSGDGNDFLYGNDGIDILIGGDGNDTLDGGEGDDTLYGGAGNDILDGGEGSDALSGGAGDDFLMGGAGNDIYYVGADHDTILDTDAQGRVFFSSILLDGGAEFDFSELLAANHAPEATGSIPAQNGKQGEAYVLTLPANLFTDPDGDTLALNVNPGRWFRPARLAHVQCGNAQPLRYAGQVSAGGSADALVMRPFFQ
jgi:hypothetical protein